MGILFNIGMFLLTVVAVLIGWLYWFYQKKFKYWESKNVEHTKPDFIFGSLKGIGTRKSGGEIIKELYDQHRTARFFGCWQFFQPTLIVSDLDLIKNILVSDFMHFHDHGIYHNEEKDPLSANLFTSDGTKWRNLRVKLTPALTSGKMKMMFPIMKECGEGLDQLLENASEKREIIEVKDVTARYSTDMIASAAFGLTTNSLKNPNTIFREMGKKIFAPNWHIMLISTLAFLVPDLASVLQLKLTPEDISTFFLGTFKETMEHREKNKVERNDFMQLLIQLKNKGCIEDVDSGARGKPIEGTKFTFEQAAAEAFGFFAGGFETTSSAVQFAILELAMNKVIQDKLRCEVRRVLAKHDNVVTYEAVQDMEYMGRIVDETLRKYPPATLITRVCTKDYKIPDSDVVIEKGTKVFIPTYAIHMDERYYPRPEAFDPDRFTENGKRNQPKFAYLAFGEGPRICIGIRFALLQIKVALTYMIKKYQFDISPEHTPLPVVFDPKSFFLLPKGGVHMRVSSVGE